MKMYHSYIKERLGHELVVIPDIAFATFSISKDECYIIDIHVEKQYRRGGYARALADDIVKIAKERGCKILKGSVLLDSANPDISMNALLSYGMKPISGHNNFLIFIKDI